MRWLPAHICAVFVGALAIIAGVEAIVSGPVGFVAGTAKWVGGLLIWGVLALVSLPFGFGIRLIMGRLPIGAMLGALFGGAVVGLSLLPILHPELYPSVRIDTHFFELFSVHTIAGLLGGFTWWVIERPENPSMRSV